MPLTPWAHFGEDIDRAKKLLHLSESMERGGRAERLVQDVRYSGVALAVGAMDAYLCDAYVDCFSAVLRSYRNGTWQGQLPAGYAKQQLPAGEVLNTARATRPNWSIRMAVRKVMEKDNMLSISRLKDSFNPILPAGRKLWIDLLPTLMAHRLQRLTGRLDWAGIQALQGNARDKAIGASVAQVIKRLSNIVQIRHDWIHNCGRPKLAISSMSHGQAKACVRDIEITMTDLDDHIDTYRLAS